MSKCLQCLTLLTVVSLLSACSETVEDNTAAVAATTEPAMHQVVVTARVPADAPTVYLSGNLPELGPWDPAALAMEGEGAERTATLTVPHGHGLEFRVTAGSWEREGLEPSGALLPNFSAYVTKDKQITAEVAEFRKDPRLFIADWQASGVEGELVYWTDVKSKFLKAPRHVVIWLPPGYDAESDKPYKVIYMQDGQNIFDPRIAYTMVDWGVDEAMLKGAAAGSYEPAIVVGIWNTADRLREYSPWHQAPQYARFLLEELMPRVTAEFNVATGPENTFALGSSMGGFVSFYLVKEHPDVFGACGCVSTHFTWSAQMIEWYMGRDPTKVAAGTYIEHDIAGGATMPAGVRLYFDYGTEGFDAQYEYPHLAVKKWLVEQGFEEERDFRMKKFPGAAHDEASWRARVGEQLDWLLGEG